ncbi:hypothetical protein CGT92_17895 [Vibrio metoecus]|uniref:hypothetical protein n=1 Tax=Vibrio metoecus TaxID=1481663 RepID=UPI0006D819D9|nr:hypothetical protein [Vibrio metoecus]EGR0413363.1 hypothetical protein [Vibrio cholerae]EIY4754928.1 hypothetical protein [Vibrio cholerae]EKF9274018.1 hypothetical protein [Vibrio cholerae]EKF9890996.1 hypothetical protein [Vibrio cholerae]KQA97582.1 hypothetical protein XV91_16650 [Vibrio metoecus]
MENWIITGLATSLVVASFQAPNFYREYLYTKIVVLSVSINIMMGCYHLGLLFANMSIPDSLPQDMKELIELGIQEYYVPDKIFIALTCFMLGNFILHSVAGAVLKYEKKSST